MSESEREFNRKRFAPKPGQRIPTICPDADPDNAYWLRHWHPDAEHAPDSPEGLAWALTQGWTIDSWATSTKRAEWQQEWEARCAQTKQQGRG